MFGYRGISAGAKAGICVVARVKEKQTLRSCVVCRRVCQKTELVRFVLKREVGLDGGSLVPDLHDRLPGRGAYSHLSAACLFDRKLGERLEYSILRRKKKSSNRPGNRLGNRARGREVESEQVQSSVTGHARADFNAAKLIRSELDRTKELTKCVSITRTLIQQKLDRLKALLQAGECEPQRRKHRVFL